MIVRPRPTVFGLFSILCGSIVPTIAPRLVAVLVFSTFVATLHAAWPLRVPGLTPAPFTLFGLALSIFLGSGTTPATTGGGRDAGSRAS